MELSAYLHGLRPIEILILLYLIPTTLFAVVRYCYLPSPGKFLTFRLAMILFVYAQRWGTLPQIARDWYPVFGYLAFYTEVRYLNRLITQDFYDKHVIRLEERLFGGQPSLYLIEALPYRGLSYVLYGCYLLYYALIPGACLTLYLLGQYEAFRETTFITLLAFYLCFLCYIVFPVASPYYEFPRVGPPHSERLIYRLIERLLQRGSSKGSAFPSSHVAVGVVLLMCLGTFNLPASVIFAPLVVGLAVATVYGRYHYAVDSFAGIGIAGISYALGRWLYVVLQIP